MTVHSLRYLEERMSVCPLSIHVVGFEKPSAIQQRAIKAIMGGRDVIAQ